MVVAQESVTTIGGHLQARWNPVIRYAVLSAAVICTTFQLKRDGDGRPQPPLKMPQSCAPQLSWLVAPFSVGEYRVWEVVKRRVTLVNCCTTDHGDSQSPSSQIEVIWRLSRPTSTPLPKKRAGHTLGVYLPVPAWRSLAYLSILASSVASSLGLPCCPLPIPIDGFCIMAGRLDLCPVIHTYFSVVNLGLPTRISDVNRQENGCCSSNRPPPLAERLI
ncbi:hypothetical protein F5Y09DRAFT_110539 [Xylaria sp. FL1042]|nr:hypothetical protein F5Y09DRAFT_110539 [Xylaria sp. FL1042]